jgi:hypothetical protein
MNILENHSIRSRKKSRDVSVSQDGGGKSRFLINRRSEESYKLSYNPVFQTNTYHVVRNHAKASDGTNNGVLTI